VDELEPGAEIRREIEADESERTALAARLGLVRLEGLSAEVTLTLRRAPGGVLIGASGRLTADVVQSCVVTMVPVSGHIDEKFEEIFAPEGYEAGEDEEGIDLSEYFDGQEIDIGEVVSQLLSLSLDPYSRAPDAALTPPVGDEPDVPERRRPFEGLAEMLKNRK
jgi:uncharacterized metal-binding protein YceD (DUF177 family)